MKLSAAVYQLKRQARRLSRQEKIPLHQALDRVAAQQGVNGWSLLAARLSARSPARKLFDRLAPGDLVLIGGRPGQGKTLLSLELAVEAVRAGRHAMVFTLEYTSIDLLGHFCAIGVEAASLGGSFRFDDSDAISAEYIIDKVGTAPRGTLVVVDYLQLLDQRRETPSLTTQVGSLASFARAQGLVIVFASQIDRSYDPSTKACPGLEDIRLPNPLDLQLFTKSCFLQGGEIRFQATGRPVNI
ncbi:KaiC protein [Hoeflea marina]|uniref:KaiC protein n=1 Tax=Hoeflea marina TaxID=274592 RepID=A0A317PCF8_9HYPH|nr:DNA helicase [Hoeflea marina]PWV95278.1 KaiC protein [Hoeflea marina]